MEIVSFLMFLQKETLRGEQGFRARINNQIQFFLALYICNTAIVPNVYVADNCSSSRVVLLKGFDKDGFVWLVFLIF